MKSSSSQAETSEAKSTRRPKVPGNLREISTAPGGALTDREAVRAVSLDATGTLFHCPELGGIYSRVLARHGVEVAPAEAARLIRLVWSELDCRGEPASDRFASHPGGAEGWWRRFLERFCEHLGAPPPSRFASAELFDRFARADAWRLFADVPEALAALRGRGLRLAVVSNWDRRLPRLLERLGLEFETVVYSEEVGVEKPHPAIFERAFGELAVPAGALLHVGDSRLHDLEGAIGAGAQALLLDRSGARGQLTDLRALPAFLA